MYFLLEIQIGTLIYNDNAEVSLLLLQIVQYFKQEKLKRKASIFSLFF
jgi:hypothetical protein